MAQASAARPAPALHAPDPFRVFVKVWLSASVIGLVALSILVLTGVLFVGIFSEFGYLVPRDAFVKTPPIVAVVNLFWIGALVYFFDPVRKALKLPAAELAADEQLSKQAYSALYYFPYRAAWLSFTLWVLGGIIGSFTLMQGISWWMRWIGPVSLALLGIGINLPQIYAHRRILVPVGDYFRAAVPLLRDRELPAKRNIGWKLSLGFAGTITFALGMAFIISYLHVQRVREEDRVAFLSSLAEQITYRLVGAGVSDRDELELRRFEEILSQVTIGQRGGIVLLNPQTRQVLFNPVGIDGVDEYWEAFEQPGVNIAEDYGRGTTFFRIAVRDVKALDSLSSPYWIVLAAPHERDPRFVLNAVVIFLLVMLGAFGVAYLISQDIVVPLRQVVNRTSKIADGRLNTAIPMVMDDEVGDLASQIRFMVKSLHRMIASLKNVGEQLSSAADEIIITTTRTTESGAHQLEESERTSKSIESLHEKIDGIVKRVGSLGESVEAASSAGFELASTASQVRETAALLESETNAIAGSTYTLGQSLSVIADGIGELKSATGETQQAIATINQTITEVRAIAHGSEELSTGVLAEARNGQDAVARTLEGIGNIRSAVEEAAAVVRSLGQKNVKIGQILDVINAVADQTNLLSFNAAIIAAQAGEHGQGFAVVADEIRKLAEQTSSSTGEIAGLIASIQSESARAVQAIERGATEVHQGTVLAQGAGQALVEITASAENSLERVRRIVSAMEDESRQSAIVLDVVERLRGAVEGFVKSEKDQRGAGETIVQSLQKIQALARRVSLAAEEQRRAADEVSRGISSVQQTMDSVIESVQQEAMEAEQIEAASQQIRSLAEANVARARELERVSQRLGAQAEALREEISRFQL